MSAVTDTILTKLLGPKFLGAVSFLDQHFYGTKHLLTQIFFVRKSVFTKIILLFGPTIFVPKNFGIKFGLHFFGPNIFFDKNL